MIAHLSTDGLPPTEITAHLQTPDGHRYYAAFDIGLSEVGVVPPPLIGCCIGPDNSVFSCSLMGFLGVGEIWVSQERAAFHCMSQVVNDPESYICAGDEGLFGIWRHSGECIYASNLPRCQRFTACCASKLGDNYLLVVSSSDGSIEFWFLDPSGQIFPVCIVRLETVVTKMVFVDHQLFISSTIGVLYRYDTSEVHFDSIEPLRLEHAKNPVFPVVLEDACKLIDTNTAAAILGFDVSDNFIILAMDNHKVLTFTRRECSLVWSHNTSGPCRNLCCSSENSVVSVSLDGMVQHLHLEKKEVLEQCRSVWGSIRGISAKDNFVAVAGEGIEIFVLESG